MSEAFKTTRWSLIVAAAGDDAIANEALSELCRSAAPALRRASTSRPFLRVPRIHAAFPAPSQNERPRQADPSRGTLSRRNDVGPQFSAERDRGLVWER